MTSGADVLINQYLDACWLEKGLSDNSLESYRRDLTAFATWLSARQGELIACSDADLNAYLAWRFEQKFNPRSTARFHSRMS